jgi:hypothetical protein
MVPLTEERPPGEAPGEELICVHSLLWLPERAADRHRAAVPGFETMTSSTDLRPACDSDSDSDRDRTTGT